MMKCPGPPVALPDLQMKSESGEIYNKRRSVSFINQESLGTSTRSTVDLDLGFSGGQKLKSFFSKPCFLRGAEFRHDDVVIVEWF